MPPRRRKSVGRSTKAVVDEEAASQVASTSDAEPEIENSEETVALPSSDLPELTFDISALVDIASSSFTHHFNSYQQKIQGDVMFDLESESANFMTQSADLESSKQEKILDRSLVGEHYVRPSLDSKHARKKKSSSEPTTAGKGWYDLPAPKLTPEIQRDLQLLTNRNYIYRDRHYKKGEKAPKYFQVSDYFSQLHCLSFLLFS